MRSGGTEWDQYAQYIASSDLMKSQSGPPRGGSISTSMMPSQFSEVLHIGGYEMAMCCEPLGAYFELAENTPLLQGRRGCMRGYQGTWEIQDGRLYLVELVGTLKDGTAATLATLFPDSPERVFADWYTGPLNEPDVNRTKYIPRVDCIYDCDLFITIDKGRWMSS